MRESDRFKDKQRRFNIHMIGIPKEEHRINAAQQILKSIRQLFWGEKNFKP